MIRVLYGVDNITVSERGERKTPEDRTVLDRSTGARDKIFSQLTTSLLPLSVNYRQDVVRGLCPALHAAGHRARQPGRLDDRTGAALEATVACRAGPSPVAERL